jgi:CRP/FNR family transcriptional regulator, dissimilatory nitrate respiration regulator
MSLPVLAGSSPLQAFETASQTQPDLRMISIMSDQILTLFGAAADRSLRKDELLFLTGQPVRFMFLVTEGRVDLVRHTQAGARVLLARAGAGQVLAEASAYSDIYHCDGTASEPSRLRAIPVATFHARLDSDPALARRWAERLAHGLQHARMTAAIRTLRTVGERLDAWLAEDKPLPPKGEWQALAHSLGVTREAFYREMAKRRALAPRAPLR